MPTYSEYLKLDELLALQRPLSRGPEHAPDNRGDCEVHVGRDGN